MQPQIQQILNQNGTKTAKIRAMLALGLTKRQIADLLTNGNYGFVQNVYKKMQLEGLQISNLTQIIESASITPAIFNKEFGVEFEAYNVAKSVLKQKLNAVGIACETEDYNHTTRRHWKIVHDGSLTGNSTFELVSPILKGQAGLDEMMKVCRVLEKCGAKVNKSCGTHVHINGANFTLDQWKRIYINYARLEKVIDGFMPESRRGNANTYCKGFQQVMNFETKIKSATNVEEFNRILGNSRYWKVNPQSYSRHKTCEFRQHNGTTDFLKISTWVRFLSNLVDFSAQYEITDKSLNGLKNFNNAETVDFYKYRTLELAA
ncbi:MAG: amidoligase family protein [Prevotellaceae bacterium]|jgi:hypothetical protein|nr:amidoligase family protein [Prevotellaceae bacterium]